MLHRPPFASTQPPTRSKRVRAVLMPACEEARVDVVFAGHAHIYERTRPLSSGRTEMDGRGPVWVITGAGGGLLRSVLPAESRADWSAAVHSSDHSFTLVEIDGDELRLRQITRAGRTVDEWRLEKSDRH